MKWTGYTGDRIGGGEAARAQGNQKGQRGKAVSQGMESQEPRGQKLEL